LRLDRYDLISFGRLAVIPLPALLFLTPRKMGPSTKAPARCLLPRLALFFLRLLLVENPPGLHHAAAAGKIARVRAALAAPPLQVL